MKETLRLIKKHIPESCTIKLNENKNLIKYNIFNEKEENIGYINLTSSGELKTYAYTGKTFKHIKQPLTEKSIIEKTNEFLNTFVKSSDLKLSSIFTYKSNYQVNYKEKDTKYNLYLPDTGVEIVLNLAGNILNFDRKDDRYKIIAPSKIITSEEAKLHYLNRINLDLKISELTPHKHYKLVYRLNEEINYMPASGEEAELNLVKYNLKSLEPYATSSKNIFRILGLDGDYAKIGRKNKKDCRIELWSKHSKRSLTQLNYDINEAQLGIIKYKIDKHTDQIVQICDGDTLTEDTNEAITNKKAYDRALDFLFTVYPEANELFDVIDSVTDDEEEISQKYEPNYMFYFNRVHDSIEVEDQIAYIGVGKYTGMINNFCAPNVTEKELAHINVFAKLSETEAKKMYVNNLKMKLSFVKKIDKQKKVNYELVYLPLFLEGNSNTHLIDAHEGTVYET